MINKELEMLYWNLMRQQFKTRQVTGEAIIKAKKAAKIKDNQ